MPLVGEARCAMQRAAERRFLFYAHILLDNGLARSRLDWFQAHAALIAQSSLTDTTSCEAELNPSRRLSAQRGRHYKQLELRLILSPKMLNEIVLPALGHSIMSKFTSMGCSESLERRLRLFRDARFQHLVRGLEAQQWLRLSCCS